MRLKGEVGGSPSALCVNFWGVGVMDRTDLSSLTLEELVTLNSRIAAEIQRRIGGASGSTTTSSSVHPVPVFGCQYSCAYPGCDKFCTRAGEDHRHHTCWAHRRR